MQSLPRDVSCGRQGIALVLGNEEIGVDSSVMEVADGVIEIPCFGRKNSLNVCSAASIVIFEALRQWGHLSMDLKESNSDSEIAA